MSRKKNTSNRESLLITKRAPEGILELCESYETDSQVLAFDRAAEDEARSVCEKLCSKGLRVLAVAYRRVASKGALSPLDEHTLTLAGFLAFADPANPDARASIAALKRDGVQVKILTGDNELVARSVCMQVGLDDPMIVLGEELETMSEPALGHVAEPGLCLCARVSYAKTANPSRAETPRTRCRLFGRRDQ